MEAVERRLYAQACAISVTLHGIAMTLAVLLISQIKPLPLRDAFQWNVSLIESTLKRSAEPRAEAAQLSPPVSQPKVRPMRPAFVTSRSEVQPNPFAKEAQQQPRETPNVTELPPIQAMEQPSTVQQQAQVVVPMVEMEKSIVPQPYASNVLGSSPSDEKVEQVIEAPDANHLPQVATVSQEPRTSSQSAEPAQPVTKMVQQPTVARADYGWLIESLGTRLAELKRYPATARNNGLEGKVLLRAVIRADGQLTEVSVQKSSGHEELDAAAMQTMRDASPLKLYQELGRAQIAITVPLVYTLAR